MSKEELYISCQWAADDRALTWCLLRQLQKHPNIRAVLWPNPGEVLTGITKTLASEELAEYIFADHPLYGAHMATRRKYYGTSIKSLIWNLRNRYDKFKERIRIANEKALKTGSETALNALCGMYNLSKMLLDRPAEWLLCLFIESIRRDHPYYIILMELSGDAEHSSPKLEVELGDDPEIDGYEDPPARSSSALLGQRIVNPDVSTQAAVDAEIAETLATETTHASANARQAPGNSVQQRDEANNNTGEDNEQGHGHAGKGCREDEHEDDQEDDRGGQEGDHQDEHEDEHEDEHQDEHEVNLEDHTLGAIEEVNLGMKVAEEADPGMKIIGEVDLEEAPLKTNPGSELPLSTLSVGNGNCSNKISPIPKPPVSLCLDRTKWKTMHY